MKIIKGPYLQFNRPEELIVLWETDAPGPSRVDYGPTAEFGHHVDQTAPTTLHRVLLQALESETTYHYRIQSQDAQAGPFTFRTAVDDSTPFAFAVFGDSRTSPEQSAGVGRQMAGHEPHFLLHSGDLVSNGTVYEQWEEQFFSPLGETLAHIPLFPVLGNHEQNSEHFYNFFPSGPWYSFDCGNARFIALDTNTASGGFEPGTEQYAWLERTLAETSALWRVVLFHHPPYSSGSHGPSDTQREALAPLLEQYQVDVIFNGHDHIYERSFSMQANRREDESGIIYVVTGGTTPGGSASALNEVFVGNPDDPQPDRFSAVSVQDKVVAHRQVQRVRQRRGVGDRRHRTVVEHAVEQPPRIRHVGFGLGHCATEPEAPLGDERRVGRQQPRVLGLIQV